MKKILRSTLLILVFAMFMLFAVQPASVRAATLKVKKQGYTEKLSTVKKKAAKIQAGKSYKLIIDGNGWMKFTAPATKLYKFTFSNLKTVGASSKSDMLKAYVNAYEWSSGWQWAEMQTKGGSIGTLYMCSKYSYSLQNHASVTTVTALPTRTGQILLKKGETIYFDVCGGERIIVEDGVEGILLRKFTCRMKISATKVKAKTSSGNTAGSGTVTVSSGGGGSTGGHTSQGSGTVTGSGGGGGSTVSGGQGGSGTGNQSDTSDSGKNDAANKRNDKMNNLNKKGKTYKKTSTLKNEQIQ